MRSISGSGNRFALAVFGLLSLVAAAWLAAPRFDLASRWPAGEPVLALGDTTPQSLVDWHGPWLVPVACAVVVAALLVGITLLLRQIPRQPAAPTLRLTGDDGALLASLEPSVLERALEERAEGVTGVLDADVRVGGTSRAPWVQASATLDEDSETGWVIDEVRQRIADDLAQTLGADPSRVDLLVHLRSRKSSGRAQLEAAPRA